MTVRILLLACLALLAACTPSLTMESGWQKDAKPAKPFSKVLIVAISEDFDRRRVFENALADELIARGTSATPSTRTMLTKDALNKETIAPMVKANGYDAVLVTRLVNQDVDVKQKRGREVLKATDVDTDVWYGDAYYYNVYTYDFSVTWEPSTLVVNRSAKVTTDLFETTEGKLIYRIVSDLKIANSESFDQNTDVAVMDEVATATARRLRGDGAVR